MSWLRAINWPRLLWLLALLCAAAAWAGLIGFLITGQIDLEP